MRFDLRTTHQDWSKGWQRASSLRRNSGMTAAGLRRLLDDSFSLRAGDFDY